MGGAKEYACACEQMRRQALFESIAFSALAYSVEHIPCIELAQSEMWTLKPS